MAIFYTSIIITTVVAIIFVVAGFRMLYVSKKTANHRLGYRTKHSTSDPLLWRAANHYAGKTALIYAAALFSIGYFFPLVLVDNNIIIYIICGFIVIEILLFFYFVEKHINLVAKQMKRTSYL